MAPDLVAALKAGWAIVHFVTVSLPGHTIRWTDAGFARWGGNVWKSRDPIFGTLHEISDITDGIDDDASPVTLTITPPSMAALEAMASADAQGGWVVIHLAAIDPVSGTLATPYQLHMGELDQPRLVAGKVRRLEYDIITGDARGLQPNEEQRQSDAFRQLIWPGERGDEFATDGTKQVWWREDEPRNAVGLLSGRGGDKKDDNKAIEFSYEPNAPLAFPFGRVGVGGTLRYRVGYGPTNRWQSVVATVGASGPVKGLVSASFDDEVTFFDANNRATNGSHRGEMWFSFLPGAQPSLALTAPTGPNADGGPAGLWSPDHKLSGRPCFMWTGKENSKKSEYRGGLPKPVLTIDGLYGYDPLQDSTRGGTGSCRIDNPTTWPWLNEGARAALNWAIGRWEGLAANGRYGVPYQTWAVGGIAAPIQTIDVQAFAHAAQIADANNWKVAAVPRSDEDKVDVLNDLLKASGAVRSRRCGMISCVSFGAPTPSVLTATEADTIAPPQVSLAPSRLDRRNTGIPSFLSAAHRWELTPIAAVTDQEWFEEDGGRHTEGYSYRYVPAAKQAAQLCYLDMATEREKVEAEVNFKAWMMALEPGVAFDWAAREYGLDGTKVRVWKRTWSPRSCSVKIKFREETDAKYAKAFAQTGEAPPAFAPPLPPVVSVPVNRPIWTSDPYPVTGSPGTIKVAPHEAMMPWGEIVSIAGAILGGLDGTKIYGVFWRPTDADGLGGGVEVEAYPAASHMADGSWIFLGWQAPANELGEFPQLPVAPPGHGGVGEAPGLPIAGDTTHLNGEPVQVVLDRLTDTATLADQNRQAVEALEEVYGDTVSAAASAASAAAASAAAAQAEAQAVIAAASAADRAGEANTAKTAAETARAQAQTSASNASDAATNAAGSAATAASAASQSVTAKDQAQGFATAANTSAQNAAGSATAAGNSASAANTSKTAAEAAYGASLAAAMTGFPDQVSSDLFSASSNAVAPLSRPALIASKVVDGWYVANVSENGGIYYRGYIPWKQGEIYELTAEVEGLADTGTPPHVRLYGWRLNAAYGGPIYFDASATVPTPVGQKTIVSRRIGLGVTPPGGVQLNQGADGAWFNFGAIFNRTPAGNPGQTGAQSRIRLSLRNVTALVAAETSASSSATSASNAAASATLAGEKASAAQTSATAADTSRGQAQTAASQASQSETNAAGSAASASTAAQNAATSRDQASGFATAASGSAANANTKANEAGNSAAAAAASQVSASAARDAAVSAAVATMPDGIQADLLTTGGAGAPSLKPSLPAAQIVNGAYTSSVAVNTGALYKAVVPWKAGEIYEVTIDVEGLAGSASPTATPYAMRLKSDYAASTTTPFEFYSFVSTPVGQTTRHVIRFGMDVTPPAPGGRVGVKLTASADAAFVRFGGLFNYGSAADRQARLKLLTIRNVTTQLAAESSATAAATSASSASASATTAGEKATAASGSAATAATKAGEASTFASQAASSASDAAGSAVTASSASGTSVTARDAAIGARDDAQAAAATAVSQSSSASASAAAAQISANLAAKVSASLPNLIRNGDFRSGLTGYTQSGSGWIVGTAGGPGAAYAFCATDGQQDLWTDLYPADTNLSFSFVGSRGGAGVSLNLFVEWWNSATGFLSYGSISITPEGGFQRVVIEDDARPTNADRFRILARKLGTGGNVAFTLLKVNTGAVATGWSDDADAKAAEASLAITAAVAADAQTRLSTVRFDVTGGAGGDPFQIWARADATGSAAGLVASELSFASVVGGTVVKAMKIIGGEVFFMRPIYIDVGSKRLIVGPGADWVMWFGPNTTAASAATRTNGHWSFGSDGKVYYGASELGNGGGFHAQANLGASVGTRTTAGQVTTALVTIDTSGATGAVSYAWTQISGDSDWSITSPNTASTSFRCNVSSPGEIRNAAFVCRVTDAGSGRSFNITVGAAAIYNV